MQFPILPPLPLPTFEAPLLMGSVIPATGELSKEVLGTPDHVADGATIKDLINTNYLKSYTPLLETLKSVITPEPTDSYKPAEGGFIESVSKEAQRVLKELEGRPTSTIEVEVTPWYPMVIHPARLGEYEVLDLATGEIFRSVWDGKNWTYEDTISDAFIFQWRGLRGLLWQGLDRLQT